MAEKLYSVKINNSGRYVRYCDDCWYETESVELRLFTKERAEQIRQQLRNHYVYSVTISNGDETLLEESPLRQKKAQPATVSMCADEESDWGGSIEW
jgi:hypothetical protein